jgi:hypothetical protein
MNHGSQICRKPNGFYSAERDSLDMICAARNKVYVEISVLFLDDGHVVHVDNSVPDFYKRTFHFKPPFVFTLSNTKPPNAGLQLRRAISIRAERKKLLEKHAIAPSAARLCYAAATPGLSSAVISVSRRFRNYYESHLVYAWMCRFENCLLAEHVERF